MRVRSLRGTGVGIVATAIVALLPASAWAAAGQVTLEVPNSSGTQFGFDVESAALAPATALSTDVRTHTNTSVGYRQLVGLNGAGVAKLATTDFDEVGCAEMRNAAFASSVFTGTDGTVDPVPGTIFVVRSSPGGFAKLRLVSIKMVAPRGLVLDFETSSCPLDATPPVITPSVTGPEGSGGWFVGSVDVEWHVADPDSEVTFRDGCDAVTLTDDTTGSTITCTATSAGGTATQSVTISLDQTPPAVAFEGNHGVYDIDERVVIDCVSTDATSGVAWDTCVDVDAPAYELGPGSHELAATAADVAGNDGAGSTSFEVVVTPEGLARLIVALVADSDIAATLQEKAAAVSSAPNEQSRAGALKSFGNYAAAKSGKGLEPATADLLSGLVTYL